MRRVRGWGDRLIDCPQLFDLEADPQEGTDFGQSPAQMVLRAELEANLRRIVDPDAVNGQAFADQERKIAVPGSPKTIKRSGDSGAG